MEETKNTRNTYIAKNGKNQEEKNNIMIMEKRQKNTRNRYIAKNNKNQ